MSGAPPTAAPDAVRVIANGREVHLDGSATIADLLRTLELTGRRVALEHNGSIVPRSRHEHTRLHDGDRVEIVHAVGGG